HDGGKVFGFHGGGFGFGLYRRWRGSGYLWAPNRGLTPAAHPMSPARLVRPGKNGADQGPPIAPHYPCSLCLHSQLLLGCCHDLGWLEAEFLLQLLEWRGRSEGFHADDAARGAGIALPSEG